MNVAKLALSGLRRACNSITYWSWSILRRKDGRFLNLCIEQKTLTVSNRAGLSVWEIKRSRDFRTIRKSFSFSSWERLPLIYSPIPRSQRILMALPLRPARSRREHLHDRVLSAHNKDIAFRVDRDRQIVAIT